MFVSVGYRIAPHPTTFPPSFFFLFFLLITPFFPSRTLCLFLSLSFPLHVLFLLHHHPSLLPSPSSGSVLLYLEKGPPFAYSVVLPLDAYNLFLSQTSDELNFVRSFPLSTLRSPSRLPRDFSPYPSPNLSFLTFPLPFSFSLPSPLPLPLSHCYSSAYSIAKVNSPSYSFLGLMEANITSPG